MDKIDIINSWRSNWTMTITEKLPKIQIETFFHNNYVRCSIFCFPYSESSREQHLHDGQIIVYRNWTRRLVWKHVANVTYLNDWNKRILMKTMTRQCVRNFFDYCIGDATACNNINMQIGTKIIDRKIDNWRKFWFDLEKSLRLNRFVEDFM